MPSGSKLRSRTNSPSVLNPSNVSFSKVWWTRAQRDAVAQTGVDSGRVLTDDGDECLDRVVRDGDLEQVLAGHAVTDREVATPVGGTGCLARTIEDVYVGRCVRLGAGALEPSRELAGPPVER